MLETLASSLTFAALATLLVIAVMYGKRRQWRQALASGGALIALLIAIPVVIEYLDQPAAEANR